MRMAMNFQKKIGKKKILSFKKILILIYRNLFHSTQQLERRILYIKGEIIDGNDRILRTFDLFVQNP